MFKVYNGYNGGDETQILGAEFNTHDEAIEFCLDYRITLMKRNRLANFRTLPAMMVIGVRYYLGSHYYLVIACENAKFDDGWHKDYGDVNEN